jgi:tRNA threonylcarbamoyladenosine biosynthesis protein TsaE
LSPRAETVESGSAGETETLGARLAERLGPGQVVVVAGEVGAGKTTLIRGACRALGVAGPVTSPTFTIGQRYEGRIPVSHLDLYRLDDLGREDPALLEDYVDPGSVAFVEWPALALGRLAEQTALEVRIEHAGGERRRIEVRAASASR